ncbi:MAG TPA: mercury methylation corrinoid protein HgcA [Pseudobacteroides sp.]|uniref:mercury methylation corrinoid protein HgcA n=1 Tax=Pseudobacteroides sp. TaxID=1968840 RepID=UPI002F94DD22
MENKSCCGSDNSDPKAKVIKVKPKVKVPKVKVPNIEGVSSAEKNRSCCGGSQKCSIDPITQYDKKDHWIIGEVKTVSGIVPRVSTQLVISDIFGAWKARWGINRMNYKINPGIYAVGNPDKDSPVLVTANYKLTFDTLRRELSDLNAWILVLDTKGINVWCAAGKGTFGTKELVSRIGKTRLHDIATHRTLILPQLGAPGVSAHEVEKQTGFKVIYGPVRAADIKEFINSGMKVTGEMRTVKFNLIDRLVLTPMELVGTFKVSLIIFGILFLLNLVTANPFGIYDFYGYGGALITGCVITPVLLPWIPGRAFAWKGWLLGLIWAAVINVLSGWTVSPTFSFIRGLGYLLVLPCISAFYAMNFTGSSTYTSFSGVLKEMKIAVPVIAVSIIIGTILILLNGFLGI